LADDSDHANARAGQENGRPAPLSADPWGLIEILRVQFPLVIYLHEGCGHGVHDQTRFHREPGDRVARLGDSSHHMPGVGPVLLAGYLIVVHAVDRPGGLDHVVVGEFTKADFDANQEPAYGRFIREFWIKRPPLDFRAVDPIRITRSDSRLDSRAAPRKK